MPNKIPKLKPNCSRTRRTPPTTRQAKLKMDMANANAGGASANLIASSAQAESNGEILEAIHSLRADVTTRNDEILAAISEIINGSQLLLGKINTGRGSHCTRSRKLPNTIGNRASSQNPGWQTEPNSPLPPRPLIVTFLNFRDKVRVMQAAQAKGKVIYGTRHIVFFPDFSAEVTKLRMKYGEVKQQLRTRGIQFGLIFPARLYTLHNGKRRVFNTPEEVE
ncbi:hypothetical protein KUCAC02_021385 [Chaenocephalus aceratus]|uniref:Uncharacterized protein n=1 Tax=Chaenocephalus aceratus TaxID=36190 RepID=A0ACB9XH85_CHAAC|nr:hypothetical protein KUCAC02_021385 [Chaenocephalus aceratus]